MELIASQPFQECRLADPWIAHQHHLEHALVAGSCNTSGHVGFPLCHCVGLVVLCVCMYLLSYVLPLAQRRLHVAPTSKAAWFSAMNQHVLRVSQRSFFAPLTSMGDDSMNID